MRRRTRYASFFNDVSIIAARSENAEEGRLCGNRLLRAVLRRVPEPHRQDCGPGARPEEGTPGGGIRQDGGGDVEDILLQGAGALPRVLRGSGPDGQDALQQGLQDRRREPVVQGAGLRPQERLRGLLGVRRVRSVREDGLPQGRARARAHGEPEGYKEGRRREVPQGEEVLVLRMKSFFTLHRNCLMNSGHVAHYIQILLLIKQLVILKTQRYQEVAYLEE
jgi:hypothetical protein